MAGIADVTGVLGGQPVAGGPPSVGTVSPVLQFTMTLVLEHPDTSRMKKNGSKKLETDELVNRNEQCIIPPF